MIMNTTSPVQLLNTNFTTSSMVLSLKLTNLLHPPHGKFTIANRSLGVRGD